MWGLIGGLISGLGHRSFRRGVRSVNFRSNRFGGVGCERAFFHAGKVDGADGERVFGSGNELEIGKHGICGDVTLVILGHGAADDPLDGFRAAFGDL